MTNYFITGFPGFLASYITKELLKSKSIGKVYLLVLPDQMDMAKQRVQQLLHDYEDQIQIISGDITKENIGLNNHHYKLVTEQTTHLFHLAAIYDLAVPYEPAYQVNVVGTSNVTSFAKNCTRLENYIYFSTAYVSGLREGTILEGDLKHDAGFKNHYEKTKYLAELELQNSFDELPITVIRPGIVVGHSKTGETLKFDGPYYMLNLFSKIKRLPIIPYIGKSDAPVNLVPMDYLVDATIYLAHLPRKESIVFHVTDPNPTKAKSLYRLFLQSYAGKTPKGKIPKGLASVAMSIPFIRNWLGSQKETIDYLHHHCRFDATNTTKALEGSGITFPRFEELIPTLVHFYKTKQVEGIEDRERAKVAK